MADAPAPSTPPKGTPPSDAGAGARRARRREDAGALTTQSLLAQRKVAELQEMWGFWQNGARAPGRKKALLEPLLESLCDRERVRDRIKVLSETPREVLLRLVRRAEYAGGIADLVAMKNGKSLETYEVEAAASALQSRGFLEISRNGDEKRRGGETFRLPGDLGDLIAGMLEEEHRGPREVFSLAGHLATLTPAELRSALRYVDDPPELGAAPELLASALVDGFDGQGLLGRLADAALSSALRHAAVARGGLMAHDEFAALLERYDRGVVRAALEDCALGTVTTLELLRFGVGLPSETVVVFAEVAERLLDAARSADQAHDAVAAAGVDLLTDLHQFLNLAASTPLRVTQGRTIYRAAQHRIRESFIFVEHEWMDREAVFDLLYSLAFRLELIEVTDESRLRLTPEGKAWDAGELGAKVEAVYGRLLDERLPEGRDFHVRRLRRAVAHHLGAAPRGLFLPLDDIPFRVRNDHLAALEDEGVDEQYRNRFQYNYTPPVESPDAIVAGLRDYLLQRLFPLGVVDVATLAGRPVGVRLTDLGRRLLGSDDVAASAETPAEAPAADTAAVRPLVVNPDFEVIHFPEGDIHEVAHRLGRFAVRTKSEQVAHYRIGRESVERAVVQGLGADEILDFLVAHARAPIPQNVTYSVHEWAARVRVAEQREGVVLSTADAAALETVLSIEAVRRLVIDRPAPNVAILRARITDWNVLEHLRRAGVYFK